MAVIDQIPEALAQMGPLLARIWSHVPNFAVALIVLLIALFVWFAVKFWLFESRRRRRELKEATDFLEKVIPRGATVDYVALPQLDEFFSKRTLYRDAWREFSETLIHDPETVTPRIVYNTRPAAEFFSHDLILESKIPLDFHRAFPGILTGAGLGITFLSILIGLDGLVGIENGQKVIAQKGVTELVENLSGKFLSSLVAVVLAMIYVGFEKRQVRQLEDDYRRLLAKIDASFARRSSEELLNRMLTSAREQENALRCFNSDLSGIMKESMSAGINEGLGPLLSALKDSVDRLSGERNSAMKEGLGSLSKELSAEIIKATGGELGTLVTSMNQTVAALAGLNEQTRQSQSAAQDMMRQFDDYLRRQNDVGAEQLQRIGAAMAAISERLASSAEASGRSVEERVQKVLERLEATTTLVLEENKKQTEHLNGLLQSSGEQFQAALQSAGLQMQETLERSSRAMFDRFDRFAPAIEALSERLERSAETSGRTLEERVQKVLERLESTSSLVLEENRKQTEQLNGLLRTASESFQGSLQSAGAQMQETLGSSSKLVFDRLDGLMSALQASSTQMADDTKRTSTHIGDLAGSMTATLDTAFKTLARDLQEMVGGLISKSAAYTDGTASQFRMMAETQERSVAKLEEARGILFLAMGTFKETINTATDSYIELKKLVTEMRQVSDSTGVAMQRLRQAQEDVVTLTSSAREGVAELAGGARNLGDAVGKNVDVIKQYERLLDQVDSSLSSILRQLDDRTAKYNAAMGEYVERSLVAFDKQLAKATAQLGNTIEELSDNLDKITAINSPR